MQIAPFQKDPIDNVKIVVEESAQPAKSKRWLLSPESIVTMTIVIAVLWGFAAQAFSEDILFASGYTILSVLCLTSLVLAVLSFMRKQIVVGIKYLLLIVLLPAIGFGVGCGIMCFTSF
jgi:hypothetical protein